jgi:hypothetical protein
MFHEQREQHQPDQLSDFLNVNWGLARQLHVGKVKAQKWVLCIETVWLSGFRNSVRFRNCCEIHISYVSAT